MNAQRWTLAAARRCHQRRLDHETLEAVAADWGITANAMGYRLRSFGLVYATRPDREGGRRMSPERMGQIRQAMDLRDAGAFETWQEIADVVGWESGHESRARTLTNAVCRLRQRVDVSKV